ncbi:MAG: DNA replication/repair protein RecF [Saccharofermentans sp.]|nr:DNA replication/repair protein RecF [Saccharofermentans sp.]
MYIRRIHLENFRNYIGLDLDVGPYVNIFYGDNAQGKTNIIESIYVGASVASHRTAKDQDMIRFGSDGYKIDLEIACDGGYDTVLSAQYTGNPKPNRILMQDGGNIRRISDYIGICNTVIFAPEDLNIVKGAPAARRKFLNTIIMKVSPTYVNLLGEINRLFEQKNATLKDARFGHGQDDTATTLDFWDFSISDLSAEIVLYRYRFAKLLSEMAAKHHASISGGAEKLSLDYDTIGGIVSVLEGFLSENGVYNDFMAGKLSQGKYGAIKGILSDAVLSKLRSAREYDLDKGISSVGINKDDLDIKLEGLQMRSFSSQGQQRSAALALKLAELEIIRKFVSSTPILLLDDVFSELDSSRRASLVTAMTDAQIFITCTDKEMIADELGSLIGGNKANYYRVSAGTVIPE